MNSCNHGDWEYGNMPFGDDDSFGGPTADNTFAALVFVLPLRSLRQSFEREMQRGSGFRVGKVERTVLNIYSHRTE
jgi:hypothetical protein